MSRFFLFLTVLSTYYSFSQEGIRLTQYMYNMSLVNPAYSLGQQDVLNMGLLYRAQWVGVQGSPRTYSFFAHAPLNDRIEVGGSLMRDDLGGFVTEDNALVDIAYKLRISNNKTLSLGIKGGVRSFRTTGLTNLVLESGSSASDPAFSKDINNISGNFGFGAFFYSENYYIGASIPNIIEPIQYKDAASISVAYSPVVTAGYVFEVSPDVKLKPSTFFRYINRNRLYVLDLNVNALVFNRLEVGVSYRLLNSVSGLINFEVIPGLQVGYAYDYSTTSLRSYNTGTHEIMLLYNLDFMGRKRGIEKSPRFF